MNLLFDSSAIFSVVQAGKTDKLSGNYTLDLARYELGNIVWKNKVIHKSINEEEGDRIFALIVKTINSMSILKIVGYEKEILTLATILRISFYDASYLYFAKMLDIPLVTDDKGLISRAKQQKVGLIDVNDL
jgi:predicted nucleic acid-binding protein